MAAAALLRSMARKLARAPPPPPRRLLAGRLHGGARSSGPVASLQPHHRHILNRGLHSSTTPSPPTGDKDKIIEELRLRLWFARASAGTGGFALTGIAIYMYFWLLPAVKERERLRAMKKLKPEDEHPSVSLAQIIAREGYRKQQHDGITENGAMFDMLPEDLMEVCLGILKETAAGLEETRADLKKCGAAMDGLRNHCS